MQGFYTILLLVASNIFMTCAWYGHLKMKQQFSWFEHLPLIGVVLFSWFLAFFEYNKIEKPNWSFNTSIEGDPGGDYAGCLCRF